MRGSDDAWIGSTPLRFYKGDLDFQEAHELVFWVSLRYHCCGGILHLPRGSLRRRVAMRL